MSKPKGKGIKITPGEIRRYEQLREAGWSANAAAEAIQRSKSWAYQYEKEKAEKADKERNERSEPVPSEDLSEAVDLVVAVKQAYFYEEDAKKAADPVQARKLRSLADKEDEKAFAIVDRFSAGIVPYVCDLAYYIANVQAKELNKDLTELFEDCELADKLQADPVTPEDILRAIPETLTRHRQGLPIAGTYPPAWYPERVKAWMEELLDIYPDFKEQVEEAGLA